jgi:hypothetical protein
MSETFHSNEFFYRAKDNKTAFAILKLYVPDSSRLKYIEAIEKHNLKMEKNIFPDAGFDLFIPEKRILSNKKEMINILVLVFPLDSIYIHVQAFPRNPSC